MLPAGHNLKGLGELETAPKDACAYLKVPREFVGDLVSIMLAPGAVLRDMVGDEFPGPPVGVNLGFFDFPPAQKKRFLDLFAEGGVVRNGCVGDFIQCGLSSAL